MTSHSHMSKHLALNSNSSELFNKPGIKTHKSVFMQPISHVGYVKSIQQSASAVAKYPNTRDSRPHLTLLMWSATLNFSRWVPSKPSKLQEFCLPLKSRKHRLYACALSLLKDVDLWMQPVNWLFGVLASNCGCWWRMKGGQRSQGVVSIQIWTDQQMELFEWTWRWG